MGNSSYHVGQVLFVIPAGKAQLIPIQVVEEITKKTLKGEAVSYVVRINKAGKQGDIASIDGEIFDSATLAQKTLLERSNAAIMQMVEKAVAWAAEWYPRTATPPVSVAVSEPELITLKGPNDQVESDENVITLEDGTKARIKLPDSLK